MSQIAWLRMQAGCFMPGVMPRLLLFAGSSPVVSTKCKREKNENDKE